MAKTTSPTGATKIETTEKKTYQGNSKRTKFSATSSNKSKKRYRGQGR